MLDWYHGAGAGKSFHKDQITSHLASIQALSEPNILHCSHACPETECFPDVGQIPISLCRLSMYPYFSTAPPRKTTGKVALMS